MTGPIHVCSSHLSARVAADWESACTLCSLPSNTKFFVYKFEYNLIYVFTDSPDEETHKGGRGWIAGVVIAVLFAVLLVALICFMRQNRRKSAEESAETGLCGNLCKRRRQKFKYDCRFYAFLLAVVIIVRKNEGQQRRCSGHAAFLLDCTVNTRVFYRGLLSPLWGDETLARGPDLLMVIIHVRPAGGYI